MDNDLQALQLAFAYGAALAIAGADAEFAEQERAYLQRAFPRATLEAAGFVDEAGRMTVHYRQARATARQSLADRLALDDKLALMELVVGTSAADGLLAPEEADALARVANELGLDHARWLAHLDALIAVGRLKRDSTGA